MLSARHQRRHQALKMWFAAKSAIPQDIVCACLQTQDWSGFNILFCAGINVPQPQDAIKQRHTHQRSRFIMPQKRKAFNLHVSGPKRQKMNLKEPTMSTSTFSPFWPASTISTRPPVITNKPCNTQRSKRFCLHKRQDSSKKHCCAPTQIRS